ncbi:MAG: hypothetical protein ACLFPD_03670 [Desulfosudaceae bacterium]
MLKCTHCDSPLPTAGWNTGDFAPCPSCGAWLRVEVFPALGRGVEPGQNGELRLLDDDAACFYHPDKKAVVPCAACGRFLCALCDLELDGRHLCVTCLEQGAKSRSFKTLEHRRILYDNLALYIAILSLLFWFVSFITAPIVLYLVGRHWKTPTSIIPRTKIRFVAAFFIAGLQLAGWSWGVYALLKNI